jgi:hypothetical protein
MMWVGIAAAAAIIALALLGRIAWRAMLEVFRHGRQG